MLVLLLQTVAKFGLQSKCCKMLAIILVIFLPQGRNFHRYDLCVLGKNNKRNSCQFLFGFHHTLVRPLSIHYLKGMIFHCEIRVAVSTTFICYLKKIDVPLVYLYHTAQQMLSPKSSTFNSNSKYFIRTNKHNY